MVMVAPELRIADVPESAARVRATIAYNGSDITRDIAPYLLGVTYTDHAGAQADELTLELSDISELWGGQWEPEETDTIDVSLVAYDWEQAGQRLQYPCGVHQVAGSTLQAPGRSWSLTLLSAAITAGARRQRKFKSWEKLTLRSIAQDVATGAGLTLLYDTTINPRCERADQQHMSDLAFLQELAGQSGIRVKVTPGKLILFDEATYEQKPPAFTMTPGQELIDWSFTRNYAEVYRSCVVTYHHAAKGSSGYRAEFTPTNPPPVKDILYINERVESKAAAERLARSRLREKNRLGLTAHFVMPFNPHIAGAVTGRAQGWGEKRDGIYFVTQVTHALSTSGARSTVEMHRALEGY
jgi:phage protein D